MATAIPGIVISPEAALEPRERSNSIDLSRVKLTGILDGVHATVDSVVQTLSRVEDRKQGMTAEASKREDEIITRLLESPIFKLEGDIVKLNQVREESVAIIQAIQSQRKNSKILSSIGMQVVEKLLWTSGLVTQFAQNFFQADSGFVQWISMGSFCIAVPLSQVKESSLRKLKDFDDREKEHANIRQRAETNINLVRDMIRNYKLMQQRAPVHSVQNGTSKEGDSRGVRYRGLPSSQDTEMAFSATLAQEATLDAQQNLEMTGSRRVSVMVSLEPEFEATATPLDKLRNVAARMMLLRGQERDGL